MDIEHAIGEGQLDVISSDFGRLTGALASRRSTFLQRT
jgi:hypothetical protein